VYNNPYIITNKFVQGYIMDNEEKGAVSREVILNRLKRIEGQVRGLQRMISEERDCESIVTQLAAVRSAIDSAGALVLNNYMTLCFNIDRGERPEEDPVNSLARVIAIWGRVKIGNSK